MKRAALLLLLGLAALALRADPVAAQGPELVDRIVATVDEEAILLSDLEREVESYRFEREQMGVPITESASEIRSMMLNRLVEVKLLVAQAKLDGIEVAEEEVEAAVARSVDEIIARFGTKAELERELARNGMSFDDLMARNRDLIRNRLFTSRMIATYIRPNIEVREDEVRAFYDAHIDEVPKTPATVTLSNILVVPQPEPEAQRALQQKLDDIEAALDRGRTFEQVAEQYSEGPNAERGGLIGEFAKGDLFHPVLEQLAWSMPIGEISQPITTELGVHMVMVTQRTDNLVTLKQILLRVPIEQSDWDRAETRAQDVYRQAISGQDFATLVENYSDDPASRDEGGLLGSFPVDKLTPEFKRALTGLGLGEIAAPVRGTAGFFILRLDSRDDPRVLPYEDVKDQVRMAVEEEKIEAELQVFLTDLRTRFYIDIKA